MIFASILYPPIISSHPQVFRDLFILIPGYDGAYRVGFDGSVWSRWVGVGRNAYISRSEKAWWLRTSTINGHGYPVVNLCRNGKPKTFDVHKLVAEAFIGPCLSGLEVCHEDGDSVNPQLYNLRYDTHSHNEIDKTKHGTDYCGERNPSVFLTWEIVDKIRAEYAAGGVTQRELAAKYNVVRTNIGHIIRNETWVRL